MKLLLKASLLAFALVLCAVNAQAVTPTIGLYTDESATNCNLLDTGTALHDVFVVYTGQDEVTSTEFMLAPSVGAALTYLGEAVPSGGNMGRADIGIAVVLGNCYDSPRLFLTVFYHGLGVSGECSRLEIRPNPESQHQNGDMIAYVKCPFDINTAQVDWANPGHITVNPDEDCECTAETGDNPSPVTASTWGGIKSLYTN
jgi:hypothetical protein